MSVVSQPDLASEEYLVGQSAAGDLDAFNQLVLMHQDLLFSHALALLGDAELAADAVQDGLIKAFRGIRNFRGGSLRSWLLRITTNCSRDLIRNSRRRPSIPLLPEDDEGEEVESPAWLADPAAGVQDFIEQRELYNRISCLIDQLPEIHRELLILIDLYELDYQEAAQALDIPLGTVKSRLARARLQIRTALRQYEDIAGDSFGAPSGRFSAPRSILALSLQGLPDITAPSL